MPFGNSTDDDVTYSVDFATDGGMTNISRSLTSRQYGTLSVTRNARVVFTATVHGSTTTVPCTTETDDAFVYIREESGVFHVAQLAKK